MKKGLQLFLYPIFRVPPQPGYLKNKNKKRTPLNKKHNRAPLSSFGICFPNVQHHTDSTTRLMFTSETTLSLQLHLSDILHSHMRKRLFLDCKILSEGQTDYIPCILKWQVAMVSHCKNKTLLIRLSKDLLY